MCRILPLGDTALTIEFGNEIDPRINARVVGFGKAIVDQGWSGIFDVVPTYRSITVHFDPLQWDSAALVKRLKALPRPTPGKAEQQGALHEIPVLYVGEWGPDLDDVAAFAGLSLEQTVTLHASTRYRVYMLGFNPSNSSGSFEMRLNRPVSIL